MVTPSASHSLLSRHYPPNFCPEREAKDSNMTEELSLVQTKYVKRKKERNSQLLLCPIYTFKEFVVGLGEERVKP